jgi:hypothetical protein
VSKERFREGLRTQELILDVLAKAHVSASLEYDGKCGPGFLVPDLPQVREPQEPYSQNPVDNLRSIFSVGRGIVVVSQKGNGAIPVVEVGVQTDILDVRIRHLSFEEISDREEAFGVVLGAPEVQSFLQSHGIGQPFSIFTPPLYLLPGLNNGPNRSPAPGVRSISGQLNDVTLADALDYVLKTFPGFWVYQNCQSPDGQRLVYFGLFPQPGRIWTWTNGETLVK